MRQLRNTDRFPPALLPVLEHFGNEVGLLAAAIGRTPQAVYAWGEKVPKLAAYDLAAATKGLFPAHTLNEECPVNDDK